MRREFGSWLTAALAGVALATVLAAVAACGGGGSGDEVASASGNGAAVSPSASSTADREEQLRIAAQCLRDHGIDLPDPDPNATGGAGGALRALQNVDRTKLQVALEACRDKLPNGGELPQLNQDQIAQLTKFTGCMREHGVDVPDPDPNQIALGLLRSGDFDLNSPTFKAAFTACQSLLPQFRTGATPTPTR